MLLPDEADADFRQKAGDFVKKQSKSDAAEAAKRKRTMELLKPRQVTPEVFQGKNVFISKDLTVEQIAAVEFKLRSRVAAFVDKLGNANVFVVLDAKVVFPGDCSSGLQS